MAANVRVGIVGAGNNTRLRHIPGFRRIEGVEITGVVNRSPESTRRAADEFSIPKIYDDWQQLVADPEIDAVCIGTWPYLHCPITLACLEAGKHVLTEARMARNADEAQRMHEASLGHPELVAQIVPSPFGFKVDRVVKELLADGYLGELRELVVLGADNSLADPDAALHWRQNAELSGLNMLTLGIMHETALRWSPAPVRVMAQTHAFIARRTDATTGQPAPVGTPDSVQVITELENGARGLYHFSGVAHHGPGRQIHLYGTQATLKYVMQPQECLLGGRKDDTQLREITIPPEKEYSWRVEEEFIGAIRGQEKVQCTDFATGVRYMQFTEAVARSAQSGKAVALPLADTQ
jgi:predicted dehydrogenase